MKQVQARIVELKQGESVSIEENEAVIIIPRGNKAKSIIEGVDPIFWDLERCPAKRTAFLDRELKKHAVAWVIDQFVIEKFPDGCILYARTSKGRLFLNDNWRWSLSPIVYADELIAYATARKYIESNIHIDMEKMFDELVGQAQ